MERCDQCGFVYHSVSPSAVPEELRPLPPRCRAALRAADQEALARTRPQPRTWSRLEDTCHVRDVLRIQRERRQLARHTLHEGRHHRQDISTGLDTLREG